MRKEIAEQPEVVTHPERRLEPRFRLHIWASESTPTNFRHSPRQDSRRGSAYRQCDRRPSDRAAGAAPAAYRTGLEFHYRNPVIERDTLYIAVSQSGRPLTPWRRCRSQTQGWARARYHQSSAARSRECGRGIYLHAGPKSPSCRPRPYLHRCRVRCWRSIWPHRDLSTADGGRLLAALPPCRTNCRHHRAS